MQIVVVDDEKESLYMFSSHVIDKANINASLELYSDIAGNQCIDQHL